MGDAQIALSNSMVFAVAAIVILYMIYLFILRAVEKNDREITPEAKQRNRGAFLKKFIFTFLYSAMTACLIYLVVSDTITGAVIYFAAFFIIGLLRPERAYKPKSRQSKIVSAAIILLLMSLTAIWTVSISIKVGAWLILLAMYLLEKIEKKELDLEKHEH
ncbi:hypothetical protein COLU111180_08615 [Cohnella lubricantis]|uniref:Uncharacterized protein n=1 Tax=Cohnella lubricantis TaxID=2163172 RepID=A0A841T4G6_9BACL|nr:hypothetical protein [Cohnella lubricantis]MBB6676453.1 hypothetical protein [Cohnella lubricantis]MBP2117540.1 putative membrane protein [Cohnella lubricantis]